MNKDITIPVEQLRAFAARCFEALTEVSESRLHDLEYPLSHDADFRFDKDDDTASRVPADGPAEDMNRDAQPDSPAPLDSTVVVGSRR